MKYLMHVETGVAMEYEEGSVDINLDDYIEISQEMFEAMASDGSWNDEELKKLREM